MMNHDDATVLTATLEAYTEAANGKRKDDFGKTVFPSKNFLATEPLCKFGDALLQLHAFPYIFRVKNQRGYWVSWISMEDDIYRKNGLM